MKNKSYIKTLQVSFALILIIHFFFTIANMGSLGRSFLYMTPIYAPVVVINIVWNSNNNIKRFSYTLFLLTVSALWLWFIYSLAFADNTINFYLIIISYIIIAILNIILFILECLLNKAK